MFGSTSRYRRCPVFRTEVGHIELGPRVRLPYAGGFDEIVHVVAPGDTLHNLAQRYYPGVDNPASLWWAIADFQPEPINDPTVVLTPGEIVFIPSLNSVLYLIGASQSGEEEDFEG